MTRLFSDTDLTDISALAKDNKFKFIITDFIYPERSEDRLKFYINSCRFIENVINNLDSNKVELLKKLDTLLKNNTLLLQKAFVLKLQVNSDVNYGKKNIFNKIEILLNDKNVNVLIDAVLEFGRTKKMYNPDDAVGY